MASSFDGDGLVAEYGDEVLVSEITRLFLDTAPAQMQAILAAVAAADAPALKAAAHRLRGAVATFGALSATELTYSLESMATAGNVAGADPLARRLTISVEDLCHGARTWLSERAV